MATSYSNMDATEDIFVDDGGFDYGASIDFLRRWDSNPQQVTLPVIASPAPVTWEVQSASGHNHIAHNQPSQTTVFRFSNLPNEIQVMILRYAFKDSRLFILSRDGTFDFGSSGRRLRRMFYLSHATRNIQAGLLYRQNAFTCAFSRSVSDLLRFPVAVTANVHHIRLPLHILAQARLHELCRLPNLKTVRIDGVALPLAPAFALSIDTLDSIPREQKVQTAVFNVLQRPAMRGAHIYPRFDAKKREVKQLLNEKKVEVTFAVRYHVRDRPNNQFFTFVTVFKIKLVDSVVGYELEMQSDEIV